MKVTFRTHCTAYGTAKVTTCTINVLEKHVKEFVSQCGEGGERKGRREKA